MQDDPVLAKYPTLLTKEKWGKEISTLALASKNVRLLLKEHFPKVKFSVKSDRFSGGSSIDVRWDRWPDAPKDEDVQKIIVAFSYGTYSTYDESFDYDRDPEREAFRKAFGSVKYIHAQSRYVSPEEIAEQERTTLDEKTQHVSRLRTTRRM